MAVPQVVSFAAMAGLPAAFGLYGCFVPVVAYSLFGGSPHLVRTLLEFLRVLTLLTDHVVAFKKGCWHLLNRYLHFRTLR